MKNEAVHLRGNRYAVRPVGKLGTCGWHSDGRPWAVTYTDARSADDAVKKVEARLRAGTLILG